MWAVSLVNGLIEDLDLSCHSFKSSQVTTTAVVVICVPVYQFIIRLFMARYSFLLWRILMELTLELISLALVTWTSAVTTSRIGSEALPNLNDYVCNGEGSVK